MKHTFLQFSLALICSFFLSIIPQTVLATNPFLEQFQATSNMITADTLGALGYDVEIDGDYAILGSYKGGAAIFKKDANQQGQWQVVKYLPHTDSYTGSVVTILGDFAFVGAPFEEHNGVQVGKVYVYHKNAGGTDNWGQTQVLQPSSFSSTTPNRDVFGFSLDIAGNSLIIGATGKGAAFVFDLNQSNNTWVEVGMLQATDASWQESFGYGVAIDGDVAMVGAYYEGEDENGVNFVEKAGAVYVFRRNEGGTNNWGMSQKFVASNRQPWEQLGWSLDIQGDLAVIGAPVRNGGAGAVYLFKEDINGQWNEFKIINANSSRPMRFGYKVEFEQDLLVVTAPLNEFDETESDSMTVSGAVFMFEKNEGGAENWGQVQKIVASDRDSYDYYGFSMAIDGTDMLIGSAHYGYEPGTIADPQFGKVYFLDNTTPVNPPAPSNIGEVGRVQADLNWTTVQLQSTYTNPIVVAGPASSNQSYLAVVRVRNVTATSFEIRLDDWDCSYSQHSQETINYMVMEEGTHVLPNGNRVTAGKLSSIYDRYYTHSYAMPFSTNPVLFAQCVTDNFSGPLVSRIDHRNTNSAQFRIRLQNPQNQGNVTSTEEVHWISMQTGSHATGLAFEANSTGRSVKHKWYTLNFSQTYSSSNPIFISMMNSSYGNDPAGMRYKSLNANRVKVKVEEENCGDNETKHTFENVAYVVFDDAGLIMPQNNGNAQGPQLYTFSNPEEDHQIENTISMKVYPNPATDIININVSGVEEIQISEVKVFDMNGKLYRNEIFNGSTYHLDVENVLSGLYLIQVKTGDKMQTFKILKN